MLLTVPQAAARTGHSPETIRRWIRAGKLPATKVGTQHMIEERHLLEVGGRAVGGRAAEAPLTYAGPAHEQNVDRAALLSRIAVRADVLAGKPVVKGTRIAVELVLDLLAAGWTEQDTLDAYPRLTTADVRACVAYGAALVAAERVYPTPLP